MISSILGLRQQPFYFEVINLSFATTIVFQSFVGMNPELRAPLKHLQGFPSGECRSKLSACHLAAAHLSRRAGDPA
jgi:hypothetical protein